MNRMLAAELDANLRALRAAAELLLGADKVLVYTGAGMSADSGVPTYRDAGGRWNDFKPFTRLGLSPVELARASTFRSDPAHAWAFSEFMRRACGRAVPHAGYAVLARWVGGELPDAFVLTSNIDGLHLRAGTPAVRVYEQYGALRELQCCTPCERAYWLDERVPLCALDESTMTATNLPDCPFCGGLARPRIEMADDDAFIKRGHDYARYDRFRASGEPDVALVIGTFQWLSWPDEITARPRVININLDANNHSHYHDPIAITMRAADALVGLDWMMQQLRRG